MSTAWFKRLTENAMLPSKRSNRAAGLDIYSANEYYILPGAVERISTDLAVKCFPGTYCRIAERSSVATKLNLQVLGGVIDYDYTGAIIVALYNFGTKSVHIKKHTKIAQIIFEKIIEIHHTEKLDGQMEVTSRGSNGFGSTNTDSY